MNSVSLKNTFAKLFASPLSNVMFRFLTLSSEENFHNSRNEFRQSAQDKVNSGSSDQVKMCHQTCYKAVTLCVCQSLWCAFCRSMSRCCVHFCRNGSLSEFEGTKSSETLSRNYHNSHHVMNTHTHFIVAQFPEKMRRTARHSYQKNPHNLLLP